ncbi:MAG: DUF805 domain-containing protein [Cocleimonas sp.]|nr:DUF805 domain-containing protein [Cocleimonas sp.]
MTNPYSTPASDLHRDLNNGKNDTSSPFSAKGRFSRLSFLAWNLILNIIMLIAFAAIAGIAGAASTLLTGTDPNAMVAFYTSGAGLFMIAFMLVSLVITIIFFIRRLHDINMSGWWSILAFIPLVNLIFGIYALVKKGVEGPNNFGSTRATPKWEKVLGIIALVLIVLYIVVVIGAIIAAVMSGGMQSI